MSDREKSETVTFRIPSSMKALLEAGAAMEQTSVTALLVDALRDRLAPRGRTYWQPGLTRRFGDWLKAIEDGPGGSARKVLLLVERNDGRRLVFEGTLNFKNTSESLVAVHPRGNLSLLPWFILRRDVVAWVADDPARSVLDLRHTLLEQGWTVAAYPT